MSFDNVILCVHNDSGLFLLLIRYKQNVLNYRRENVARLFGNGPPVIRETLCPPLFNPKPLVIV